MITLNDVAHISISHTCAQSYPCQHRTTITLTDGRSASELINSDIYVIVSNLADEKINPETNYKADAVRKHFEIYKLNPDTDWIESVEEILYQIFPPKKKEFKFDMNEALLKAKEFSNGDEEVLDYIKSVLNSDKFKKDPENYFPNWLIERGSTEEYRGAEDAASGFFDQFSK